MGEGLSATVEQLRAAALGASDASGHFPALYARVTDAVDRAVSDGRFRNGEAMRHFARRFAAWYLDPLAGTRPVPGSWRAAWDVASDGRLLVVQHLLLGINAHINHDLPQVVVELADEQGSLAPLRPDFDGVNDVLAETYPEVLGDLGRVSRWVNAAAMAGGGRLFDFSLTAARAQAWRAATLLFPLDEGGRRVYAGQLDALVRVLAHLVARPRPPASWLLPGARRLEEQDARRVTVALLGPLA